MTTKYAHIGEIEDVDLTPYIRLAQAIILQAIKDYAKKGNCSKKEQDSVKVWVKKRLGTFNICATAWDRTPEELQEVMERKIRAIDQGEPLKLK